MCITCSRILLGKLTTHFVLFQRLNSFNKIPGPLSIGLSAAPSIYFALQFGWVLVEEFVRLEKIFDMGRVLARLNSVRCSGIDLECHPNLSKHFWVHSIARFKILYSSFSLLSLLAINRLPF